jgi:hypothetical protein
MHARLRNGLAATAFAMVIVTSAAGVAIAAGVSAPISGGPAGATACVTQGSAARSGATVASLRAFADCEINRRLTTLGQLSTAVGASKGLTSSDAAALNAAISAAGSGLTSLKATIDSQTALPALRLEIVQIVTKYRVYELLLPQVRLTIAADSVLALKTHFDDISSKLADRIATAQGKGKDVTAAQAALAAMNAAVADAEALVSPLPARLLALTPAQFDLTTATTLQGVRAAIGRARDDLKAATKDGRDAIAALK